MKASHRWLAELSGVDATPEEVADALTKLGLEVEDAERFGEGLEHVVVAEVRASERVPDKDKLSLVTVFDGEGERQVICGAPNVPAPGGRVVLAKPGAVLPGDFEIAERTVGGVVSSGMLCSETVFRTRGDRVAFASRLALRHGLTMSLAFRVADNQLSLLQAKSGQTMASYESGSSASHTFRRAMWLGSLAVVLITSSAVLGTIAPAEDLASSNGPRSDRWAASETEVTMDQDGQVVSITAPDPALVLSRYCEPKASSRRCEPLELRATVPARAGMRLGVFRELDSDASRVITIQRQASTREWTVGDGSQPVRGVPGPVQPGGVLIIPVGR